MDHYLNIADSMSVELGKSLAEISIVLLLFHPRFLTVVLEEKNNLHVIFKKNEVILDRLLDK